MLELLYCNTSKDEGHRDKATWMLFPNAPPSSCLRAVFLRNNELSEPVHCADAARLARQLKFICGRRQGKHVFSRTPLGKQKKLRPQNPCKLRPPHIVDMPWTSRNPPLHTLVLGRFRLRTSMPSLEIQEGLGFRVCCFRVFGVSV